MVRTMSVIALAYSAKERAGESIVKQLFQVNAKLHKIREDVANSHAHVIRCSMWQSGKWQKSCTRYTSHRPSAPDAYRRAATDVGNTPQHEKSADLPVERPAKFERSNLRLLMHNRWREVVSHNSASAALECSRTRWRTRASAAASQLAYRPLARQGATTPVAKGSPHCFPSPRRSLSFACVMPFYSQARYELYQSFFIDPIVHISILNDNLPSRRLIIFQHFGVHPRPEGFIQWEVSSFVTFERKS